MAALTIASATIDSTGQSCTVAIGGAVGILSFTSSPGRGFYVRATFGGVTYETCTGTYSISGASVIVPLLGIVPSTATVSVIGFNGNLTDTLSSTAPTNTVSATNNSTMVATFLALDFSKLGINGFFASVAGTPNLMQITNNGLSSDATIDTVFNCTAVSFVYKSSLTTAPFAVSVDGGAYNNVGTSDFGGVTIATLGAGLSAGLHAFSIKYLGGTTYVDTDAFVQVYGGTGAMTQPFSGTGSAPGFWATTYPSSAFSQYPFLQNANSIKSNFTIECGTTASAAAGNAWNLNTASIFPVGTAMGMSFAFQVAGAQSVLKMFCAQNNACYDMRVDGVSVGHVTVTANSPTTYGYVDFSSFVSGLSAGNHSVVITLVGLSGQPYLGSLTAVGSAITTSPPTARTHAILYGDSITACPFTTSVAANGAVGYLQAWPYMVANVKNWAYTNRGISGSATHYFNGSGETPNADAGEHRTTDITGCSHVPTYVLINYGDNDVRQVGSNSAGRPGTTTTQAITLNGSPQTVTVTSSTGFITGQVVQVDIGAADPSSSPGANYEAVTLTGVAAGTVSGIFTKNHSSGIVISRPELVGEYQASVFNMLNLITTALPSVIIHYVGTLPVQNVGQAAKYGLTSSGSTANVGSANLLLWNTAVTKTLLTSGSGNGNGSGSFLAAPQAAQITYHDSVPWQMNGTANPAYNVVTADYTTNYVDVIHPNDNNNGLPNATNLGNGIYALNVLAIFNTSGPIGSPDLTGGMQQLTGGL